MIRPFRRRCQARRTVKIQCELVVGLTSLTTGTRPNSDGVRVRKSSPESGPVDLSFAGTMDSLGKWSVLSCMNDKTSVRGVCLLFPGNSFSGASHLWSKMETDYSSSPGNLNDDSEYGRSSLDLPPELDHLKRENPGLAEPYAYISRTSRQEAGLAHPLLVRPGRRKPRTEPGLSPGKPE